MNTFKCIEFCCYFLLNMNNLCCILEAVIIKSRYGKDMLLYKNYTYNKRYNSLQHQNWFCSISRTCKAYINTDRNNKIISMRLPHNHNPPYYKGRREIILS